MRYIGYISLLLSFCFIKTDKAIQTNNDTVSRSKTQEFIPHKSNTPAELSSCGNRVTNGLQVLYDFNEGSGSTVNDVSGVGSALNLTIANTSNTTWTTGGLQINAETILESATAASKVSNAIISSNAFTMEAWVKPSNTTQDGPARIMTVSQDWQARNFTLGQQATNYAFRFKTTTTGNQGYPTLEEGPLFTSYLQHIIYTWDGSTGNEYIYIDGVLVFSGNRSGNTSTWDTSYKLAIANEIGLGRDWLGEIKLAAIYDRALNVAEISTNFNEGSECDGTNGYTCNNSIIYDHYAASCTGSDINLNIPNLSNVTQSLIEVVYKGCDPGASITISSSIGNVTLDKATVPGSSSNVYTYTKVITGGLTNIVHAPECGSCFAQNGLQSVIVFALRDLNENLGYSNVLMGHHGHCNIVNIPLAIPPANEPRDITLKIPISEVTDDGRYLIMKATSNTGNVIDADTIYGSDPALGDCCLAIMTLQLDGVPGNTSIINVEVITDSANNPNGTGCGQSWDISGTYFFEYECPCTEVTANAGPNKTICAISNPDVLLEGSASAGTSPYTYSWSPTTGLSNPNIAQPTASPAITTTYTLTVSGDDGCTDTDDVIVTVNNNYTDPGTITGDESSCGGFDPAVITNVVAPSGGNGGSTIYIWQHRTWDCATESFSVWSNISSSNAEDYDPPFISSTTEYRRVARRSSCSAWVYSAKVVKEVVDEFTNGGSIGGDETLCGTNDPGPITNLEDPSGGCGGIEFIRWYKWELDCATGNWITPATLVTGATDLTYDPTSISVSTRYRRYSRRSATCPGTNGVWVISNFVYKHVVTNVTSTGTVSGAEEMCGPYDPSVITITTLPTGGCGADIEYRWYERTLGCGSTTWNAWVLQPNSNASTYDPGPITQTTQYAYHTRRGNCTWLGGGNVIKTVNENFTDAGVIDGDESECGSYDPSLITTTSDPSGGCGTFWGIWQKREYQCGTESWGAWGNITGTTSQMTYDPPTITTSTEYRRVFTRTDCNPNYVYSNVVLKEIVEEYTDGGDIGGTETSCGSFDPSPITNLADPSGGCGGVPFFRWHKWEMDCSTGNWITPATLVSGATDLTYDPPTLSVSTRYRRYSRRSSTCPGTTGVWEVSNFIYKYVEQNLTDLGTVEGTESMCGSYDPSIITITTLPSGGCDADIEYRWYERTQNCNTGEWGVWVLLANTNNSTYDPPTINATTQYAYHARRGQCDWIPGGSVVKTVIENFTDAGEISGDESNCGAFDPAIMTSVSDPTGGCGTYWGVWQKREWNCGTESFSAWGNIDGTNSFTYDPPTITTTTEYRRVFVRSSCNPAYLYSNVITKEVIEELTDGGDVSGDEIVCGAYDPGIINNIVEPSGGCSGNLEIRWYKWERDCATGSYGPRSPITGANSLTYNPPTINTTTRYRRYARRSSLCPGSNGTWMVSNFVYKTVVENVTTNGTIIGAEEACGTLDPSPITFSVPTSGGCGADLEYRWWTQTQDCSTGTWSSWTMVAEGIGMDTYDPPPISVTTNYAFHVRRGECDWKYGNGVIKTINQNFTDAGEISGDESFCGGFDPATIVSDEDPSGGCGTFTTVWQNRVWDCSSQDWSAWSNISGSSGQLSYDPTAITSTTEYRRVSWKTFCGSQPRISNTVTKEVVEEFTEGGEISGDESFCGTYNPAPITSLVDPSGGCSGTIETRWYKWEMDCATGNWITPATHITGESGLDYDPPSISVSTRYIRLTRRSADCDGNWGVWMSSNYIYKYVIDNITDHGSITGTEVACSNYDAGTINITVLPSGGCGADIEYRWYERTQDCATETWGDWILQANSNTTAYSHGIISQTTQFAYHARRGDCPWIPISSVIKYVNENYTDGGKISGDESSCGGFDPSEIVSDIDPSGGCGNFWSVFQMREFDCTTQSWGSWSNIPESANQMSYDPPPITTTTQYQRLIRRDECQPDYIYSNSITKEVISEFSDGGDISGDEEMCGAYDPGIISDAGLPSGGCGGNTEYVWYKWEFDCSNDQWITPSIKISGATSPSYDPPAITQTTRYRRYARRSNLCDGTNGTWMVSNFVYKTVVEDIIDKGVIVGAEESCGAFDPSPITFSTPTSGGCGADIEYRWFKQTKDCSTGDWNTWELITSGIDMDTYDPDPITETTHYAFHVRIGDCDWQYGNGVIKSVHEDITDPGTITGAESQCDTFDPSVITGTVASGGCSTQTPQYIWQSREGTSGTFINISGANSVDYDPPTIYTTTQYRRSVGYEHCPWTSSNIITKTISSPTPVFCQRYRFGYGGDWGTWIDFTGACEIELCEEDGLWDIQFDGGPNIDTGWVWTDEDGNIDNETDEAVVFSNIGFDDAGIYTGVLTNEFGCESTVTFEVIVHQNPSANASNNGPITCSNPNVTLTANPSGLNYQWTGPNGFNSTLENPTTTEAGIYSLIVFDINGCADSTGTEVLIDNTPPSVVADDQDICIGETATLTASGGVSYSWNTGETTPSIDVTPSSTGTYSVIVTGTNGCTTTKDVTVTVNPLPNNNIIVWRDITCSAALGYIYAEPSYSGSLTYADNTEYISAGGSCGDQYISTQGVTPHSVLAHNLSGSVNPGNTYEFSFKYKSSGSGTKYARIVYYDASWGFIETQSQTMTSNPNSWTDFTVSGVAPASAANVQIGIIISAPNTVDTDCWDFKQQGGSSIFYQDFEIDSPYSWSGPNGNAGSSRGIYFGTPGTYTVTITNPNSGCTNINSITMDGDTTPPDAIATNDGAITCSSHPTVTLTASSATSGVTYLWSDGAQTATTTTTTPGVYTVTVTDPNNGCSATAQTTVVLESEGSINSVTSNCQDGDIVVNYTMNGTVTQGWVGLYIPGADDTDYIDWKGFTNMPTGEVTFSNSIPTAGTYEARIFATGGYEYCDTETFTLNPLPTVTLNLSIDKVCEGASSFNLSGGSPSNGVYSGIGVSAGLFDPAQGVGHYTITYTYTDGNGCINSASDIMIVSSSPEVELDDQTICEGDSIILDPELCENYVDIIAQRPLLNKGWANNYDPGGAGIIGDGEMCFTLDEANLTSANMFGLNDNPHQAIGYGEMDYAIYILIRHEHANPYLMQIRENGTSTASPYNSTVSYIGSTFCIKRTGTTIEYLMDGAVMYTSTVASSDKLYYDHSIHSNDGIYTNGYSKFVDISLCGALDFNFDWSTGETSKSIEVSSSGSYTLDITDENGCQQSEQSTVTVNGINNPTATVDGPILCDDIEAQLTATPSGLAYAWEGPDNFISSVQSPTTTIPGIYNVTISDPSTSCSTELEVEIQLESEGAITGLNYGCNDEDISIDYTISGSETQAWIGIYNPGAPGGSYLDWDWVPNIPGSGTVTLSDHGLTGGTYEARLYSTAGYILCESESFDLDGVPDISLIADGAFTCSNPEVLLTATPGGMAYSWSGPGGFFSSDQSPTITAAGEYTITVTDPSTTCFSLDTISVELESAGSIDGITSSCNHDVIDVDYTISGSEPQAWIGLYEIGAAQENFIVFSYVPTIPGSSTVNFTNHGMPPGDYEARLYSTGGYVHCQTEAFAFGQEPECLISGRTLVPENSQNEIYTAPSGNTYAWSIIAGDANIDGVSNGINVEVDLGNVSSTLQLVLTSPQGCSSTCTIDIDISPDGQCSYRDEFILQAFDNSDGTEDWTTTPWIEYGDDGDPVLGDIVFVSQTIRMDNDDSTPPSIERDINLAEIANAVLSFDYNQGSGDLESDDIVQVQIYDGSTWHIVLNDTGTIPPNSSPSIGIAQYANAASKIRIAIASGYADPSEYVFFDNVTISGDCKEPEICDDGIDNDFDGLTDCEDPDCSTYVSCNCQTIITNRHIYFKTRTSP